MKRSSLAITALSLLSAACTPSVGLMQSSSAGQIGCQPDSITVSNGKWVTGGYLWNASCNGKTYLCTLLGNDKATQASCAVAQ